MVPDVAVTVIVSPLPADEHMTRLPLVVLIVASALPVQLEPLAGLPVLETLHVTVALQLPLPEQVGVAVIWTVEPSVALVGEAVTLMDASEDELTVSVVLPVAEEVVEVAVIVLVPCATAVASPVPVIVATDVVPDDHVTDTFVAVLPSLFTPLAVNCCVWPTVSVGLAGLTVIELSVGLTKNLPHELNATISVPISVSATKRQTTERFLTIFFPVASLTTDQPTSTDQQHKPFNECGLPKAKLETD
jgi:hypothetical protein